MKYIKNIEKELLELRKKLLIKYSNEPISNCLLTPKNIETIVIKLPYSEGMLKHQLDLENTSDGQLSQIFRIVDIIDNAAISGDVIFKNSKHQIAYVLKGGGCVVVDLTKLSCSCFDGQSYRVSNGIDGMCCHLAKVIACGIDKSLSEKFNDVIGLIKRHAACNTDEPMIAYPKIGNVKNINYYDVGRFIYVTKNGECESYYLEGRIWCALFGNGFDNETKKIAVNWIENKFYRKLKTLANINESDLVTELAKGEGSFCFKSDCNFDMMMFSIYADHFEPKRNIVHIKVYVHENIFKSSAQEFSGKYYRDDLRIKLPKKYMQRYAEGIMKWVEHNDGLFLDKYIEYSEVRLELKNKKKAENKEKIIFRKPSSKTLIDRDLTFGLTKKRGVYYFYIKLRLLERSGIKEIKRQKKIVSDVAPIEWIEKTHENLSEIMTKNGNDEYEFPWSLKDIYRIMDNKLNSP